MKYPKYAIWFNFIFELAKLLVNETDDKARLIIGWLPNCVHHVNAKQACTLAFIVFHGVCMSPDSLGSMWCHNCYQTVIIMWLHLVIEHDTQCKLRFKHLAVEIWFTNKCSIYITLSVDLLFDHLPLNVMTFTQMAMQIPFTSDCSFYKNFNCWSVIRFFTLNKWIGACNFCIYCCSMSTCTYSTLMYWSPCQFFYSRHVWVHVTYGLIIMIQNL